MSNTRVVNIRKESCDVYIGRAGQGKDGYFGNPFRLEATMTRGGTLDRYRKYFYYRLSTDEKFRRRIGELQGKTLGCFCKPNPCHGDIIKEYLERMEGCTDEIAIEKNDNDMAEKIIFLLNRKDVRCAMGRNARKYVQQHLSLDAISQQFYELISPLL